MENELIQRAPTCDIFNGHPKIMEKIHERALIIGRSLTGKTSEDDIVNVLDADKELTSKFAEILYSECLRLSMHHIATMENQLNDGFARYARAMRPTFGYATILTYVGYFLILFYNLLFDSHTGITILKESTPVGIILGGAFTVTGAYVWVRGKGGNDMPTPPMPVPSINRQSMGGPR